MSQLRRLVPVLQQWQSMAFHSIHGIYGASICFNDGLKIERTITPLQDAAHGLSFFLAVKLQLLLTFIQRVFKEFKSVLKIIIVLSQNMV
jgi:hypothetical protein